MDLSFINLPESKPELLAVLNMAFKAGQKSMGAELREPISSQWSDETDVFSPTAVPVKKYQFKHWLSRLAKQWSNAEE